VAYLNLDRFDRLNDEEILRRIGDLLAVAIGRREEQRLLRERTAPMPAASGAKIDLQRLAPPHLIRDDLERRIVAHLGKVGRATSRELAAVVGCTGRTMARKLTRLRAAGLCQVEGRSRMACYRLRTDFGAN
jgi:hypothetical protein